MKAFIFAAGLGTRMGSLTEDLPKVMLTVGGKPVIEHLIILCRRYGVNDLVINLHWQPEKIITYLGRGEKLGVKITYSREKQLLGTAGGLKKMERVFDDTFLVLYGDVMMKVNLDKLLDFHAKKKGMGTLVVHESSHPKDTDLLELDDNDQVKAFWSRPRSQEPKTTLSNAGLLVLEPEIFQYIPKGRKVGLDSEIHPLLLKKGISLFGYQTKEYFKDMGTPERYAKVQGDF